MVPLFLPCVSSSGRRDPTSAHSVRNRSEPSERHQQSIDEGISASRQIVNLILASGAVALAIASARGDGGEPATGKIAWVSYRDSGAELYVMNADGSGQTNLTNSPASDVAPSWSLDGACMTFDSDRDGNVEIYIMNADGSEKTRPTDTPSSTSMPTGSQAQ